MRSIFITIVICILSLQSVFAQCNFNFSLGNDTVINCGGNITITAPSGLDGYTWFNNSHNQAVTVGQAGTFWCTGYEYLSNAVTNGDFNGGATGFQSDYIPGTGGTWGLLSNEGQYAVTSNSSLVHNNFINCYDHTVGNASGSMLVVNGSSVAGLSVWEQTITVQPNTNYTFSAWGMSVVSSNPAQLSFSVNGSNIGSSFNLSSNTCNWQQFTATWNSGANTTATIAIVNQNTAPSGNDFAIDDIAFSDVCTYSDTIHISYPPQPVLTLSGGDTICEGDSITLIATTDIPGSNVTWFPGLHTDDTITVAPSSNTTYSAIAISPQNCGSNNATTSVVVTPYPEITAYGDTTICLGDTTELYYTSTLPLNSINWSPSNYTDSVIYVSPTDSTSYIIEGESDNGCATSDTVTVLVNPIPTVTIDSQQEICNGDSATVHISYDNSHPTTIYWNNIQMNQDSVVVSPSSDTSFTVYITQYQCISESDSTRVLVNEIPTISTVDSVVVCPGDEFEVVATTSSSNATITWLPDYSTGEYYTNSTDSSYTISAFANSNGCLSDTSYTVIVIDSECDCIWKVPNVFTPNGDGVNDEFYFVDENESCILRNYHMVIFNRWGKTVWEGSNLNERWDGKNNGSEVAEGTYFWKLNFTDQNNLDVNTTGSVTLLK